MAKATKVPRRREPSDDFVVAQDEKEYRPHAGEWVEWRGRSTIGSLIVGLRLQQLLRLSGLDERESKETSRLYEEVCNDLAASIAGWTWTDDSGERLPSPPGAATIRALSWDEVFYLLGIRFGSRSEEEAKNGSSPSTSRSTRRRARKSRSSG